MLEKVKEIKELFEKDILNVNDLKVLNELRTKYLGKQGMVTELSKMMKDVPNEDKKDFGMKVNQVRNLVSSKLDSKKEELETKELNEKLESEKIDITLPSTPIPSGSPNILEMVVVWDMML